MSRHPITREGYDNLMAEIKRLETVEMPRVAQLIAQARHEGDLSENAEYHGQRENLAMLQAKVNQLKTRLSESYLVEKNNSPKDRVLFGAKVTLKDLDADFEEIYELVGAGEEDYSGEVMRILCTSPLAQQLLHHRVGEQVEVQTPGGKVRYEILAIE